MKLVHPQMEHVIIMEEGVVTSLVIENQNLLYSLLTDLKKQTEKEDGKWILSENDAPIPVWKTTEMVTDFVDFELNQKTLINKIIGAIGKSAVSEKYYHEITELAAKTERVLGNILYDFDSRIMLNPVTVDSLIKGSGIYIEVERNSLSEKILSLIELKREFEGKELTVLVNFRSYISEDDFRNFADTIKYKGYRILLIENKEYTKVDSEKRHIIDKDLCEF